MVLKKRKPPKYPKNAFRRKRPPSLLKVEFTWAALQKLPDETLDLFIVFSMAHNELSALARLHIISTFSKYPDEIQELYGESQRLVLIKLFAGKVHETWEVVRDRYFGTKLSKSFDGRLNSSDLDSLKFLKRYFSRRDNLVSVIRNEAAFHYTRDALRGAITPLRSKKYRSICLDGHHAWNNLYTAGEFAYHVNYIDRMMRTHDDPASAMYHEIGEVGGEIMSFVRAVLTCILDEILDYSGKKAIATMITMANRPKVEDFSIPGLLDLGSISDKLQEHFGGHNADVKTGLEHLRVEQRGKSSKARKTQAER